MKRADIHISNFVNHPTINKAQQRCLTSEKEFFLWKGRIYNKNGSSTQKTEEDITKL